MKPEQREAMSRALHRADVEPRRFDPRWNVHEWPELTDEAREYWRRLADALMPIVREEKERAARECMEQAVHIAFTGRLPDFDDIVRRVCGE